VTIKAGENSARRSRGIPPSGCRAASRSAVKLLEELDRRIANTTCQKDTPAKTARLGRLYHERQQVIHDFV
jgi:hypothetical protein